LFINVEWLFNSIHWLVSKIFKFKSYLRFFWKAQNPTAENIKSWEIFHNISARIFFTRLTIWQSWCWTVQMTWHLTSTEKKTVQDWIRWEQQIIPFQTTFLTYQILWYIILYLWTKYYFHRKKRFTFYLLFTLDSFRRIYQNRIIGNHRISTWKRDA
jgi:hypothetical protein